MGRPTKPYCKHYSAQKQNARRRGIPFEFTYDTWIEWWGNDINLRGKGAEKLVMARNEDQGPYHPNNVYKDTNSNNVSLGNKNKIFSKEYREKLSIASYKRWGTYKEEQPI